MAEKPTYQELERRVLELEDALANQISQSTYHNLRLRHLILEREEAETELKKNEAYLRTLVHTLPDLVWMKNPEGVYLSCNSRFEKFFGAEEKEIVGKTDYDFVGSELADFFRRNDNLAVEKGAPSKNEEEITFAEDGHHEFLETIKTPIHGDDGKLIGVLGIGRDITERKKAESRRLANLRFLENLDTVNRTIHATRDLEDMMRDVLDLALTLFDCERAYLLYPCDPASETWRVPMERTRPKYPGAFELGAEIPASPFMKKIFQRLLEAQKPVAMELNSENIPEDAVFKRFGIKSLLMIALCPKTGTPWQFGLQQCSYLRKWTSDEKKLFQEIGRRLTDALTSMLVMKDLQKSEARFRIIFDTAADPIFLNDMETGRFLDVNQAACRHLGYEKEEFLAMSLADVNDGPPFDFRSHFMKNLNEEESLFFESGHIRKDGSVAVVEINSRRILHQGRKTLLSIVRDVTPRKQIERELARYRADLEKMVEQRTHQLKTAQDELVKKEKLSILGQLTAMVSHELRNPLGVIRTSNFFLQRRFTTADEKVKKHLKRIDEQISLCDAIVADMLAYTRSGKTNISPEKISPWLTEVVEQIKEQEGIEIGLDIPENLPPVPHDPAKMRRVIINLLANSIQAVHARIDTAPETAQPFIPDIRVDVSRTAHRLTITISDNGAGMSPETRRQAFEPLFTTRSKGTGLGLAIVKKIVEEHRGTLFVESQTGKGTQITLTLPCG